MDNTLVIIKPHAIEKKIIGEIISRFEKVGLNIIDIKLLNNNESFWNSFYPSQDEWYINVGNKTIEDYKINNIDIINELGTDNPLKIGQNVKEWLVNHMSSGPGLAILLEGNQAPSKVRKMCGKTLPNQADPGTIRFDYSFDSPLLANLEKRPVFNIIHASNPEEEGEFERERKLIFG